MESRVILLSDSGFAVYLWEMIGLTCMKKKKNIRKKQLHHLDVFSTIHKEIPECKTEINFDKWNMKYLLLN